MSVWQQRPSEVFAVGLDKYIVSIMDGLEAIAMRYQAEIETWMKTNARWVDRTGNARQSLYAEVARLIDSVVIAFDHGMDYGFYLELSHAGRYAIIAPALDEFAPRIWQDVKALLS